MDDLAKRILNEVSLEKIAPRTHDRPPVDHWPPAVLLERAAYLRKLARFGDGSAKETIREYPQHAAMLLFRSRSGEAEIHQNYAHFFYVLAGAATLVVGGTLVAARALGEGETRGDSIEGGARQELKAGEFAHVPAGAAHQFLLNADKTITCLVLRVQEIP